MIPIESIIEGLDPSLSKTDVLFGFAFRSLHVCSAVINNTIPAGGAPGELLPL